jgi:hypothetical protein
MKTLFSIFVLLLLSSLNAQDSYKFNIYNVETYNRSIPALSLAFTPKNDSGIKFIVSYVSTLFKLDKTTTEYVLNNTYDNVTMSLNFKF